MRSERQSEPVLIRPAPPAALFNGRLNPTSGADWNPGGDGGAMAACGFDREFATDHLQSFPHAEQSQAAVSFRAEDALHIKGSAVVCYLQANPVRQFFNFNFHRAGLRMDGHVIEGFQSDAIEDGTPVEGQLVYRRIGS